ncbi:hypothetical protein ASF66_21215 [Pseudomonas sp. Leaf129]|nr:hypothetical protein ASF66_21215 [Pseudomonas sp. Leaf129]
MTEVLAGLRSAGGSVANTRSMGLMVPVVLEAVPTLDLTSVPNGATVRVYFCGLLPSDLVAIVLFGTPGAGTPDIDPVSGNAVGHVDFTVPASALVPNDGGMVKIVSAVVRGDEQWVSDEITLAVGSLRPVPVEIKPFITRAWDTRGNVGDGGSTFDAVLNIEGMASPGMQVEIFRDGISVGKATVDSNGNWTHRIADLPVGAHTLAVTALYGGGLTSPARAVTRATNLTIKTGTMVLDGVHLHQASSPAWWRETGSYMAKVTSTRKATGGTPPIRYSSANTRVATVDDKGHVISQANGSTRITATDALGSSASYAVTCSNNYNLYQSSESEMTYQGALDWIKGSPENRAIPHNGTTLGRDMLSAMSTQFVSSGTFKHHTGTPNPGSQTTNLTVSKTSEAPNQEGPFDWNTKARAMCYRIKQ